MPTAARGPGQTTRPPPPTQDSISSHDASIHSDDIAVEHARKHPLKVLHDVFSASRRKRRDNKTVARGYVASALSLTSAGNQKQAFLEWKSFIAHCEKAHLSIEHELARAMPHTDHPLTQMLATEDYEGIAVLVPWLKTALYEPTLVKRTEQNVYVGHRRGSTSTLRLMAAEGRGVCFESNGRRTQGTWRNDQPATVRDFPSSGDVREYCGQMSNDAYHGQGTARYKNGDVFVGEWREGRRDGEGALTMNSGDVLHARWRNGAMQPGAHFETKDGRIYRGDIDLNSGLPRGRVTMMWNCDDRLGACYDGFVEKGQPQGIGKYVFGVHEKQSGLVYEGPWLNGQKHGCGVLTRQIDFKRSGCAYLHDVLQSVPPDEQDVPEIAAPVDPDKLSMGVFHLIQDKAVPRRP